MIRRRFRFTFRFALPFVILWLPLRAQQSLATPSQGEEPASSPVIPLTSSARVSVPFATGMGLTTPILCNPDGTIFLRSTIGAGVQDVMGISDDGNFVTRFGRDKMNDISNPTPLSYFPTSSTIYILTVSHEVPVDRNVKIQKPNGETEAKQIRAYAVKKFFIARFNPDGSYRGALPLDIPFDPMPIGVFSGGSFLVAGAEPGTNEPRVAILDWRGQLQGFLHIKDDIDKDFAEFKVENKPTIGKNLHDAVRLSEIVADSRNLLLVRTGIQSPIFSISEGEEIRAVKLHVGQHYDLFGVKPTDRGWVVQYTVSEGDTQSLRFVSYLFDRITGNQIEEYAYPSAIGFGLACTDGADFKFLTESTNDALEIVTLRKAPSSPKAPLSRIPIDENLGLTPKHQVADTPK